MVQPNTTDRGVRRPMDMLRISTVEPLERYVVSVTLTDGSSRVIDLESCLEGEMYQPLREDPALFRAVQVEHGTLAWPTGQDLDPDVLLGNEIAARVASRYVRAMPAICEFDGLKIYVNGNDHNPPHIHVYYGKTRKQERGKDHSQQTALVRIDDSVVFRGWLDTPQLKAVEGWMAQRRPLIALAWVQVQAGRTPDKVPPP